MIFGPVPLAEATGAILAHSVSVTDGRLRKGIVLTEAHVATLQEAGVAEVIVARPEAGDLHEDIAAMQLAEAACGTARGITLSRAFTGRVNLLAAGPGVVRLDPARINAANAVHPMITIATVPEYQQMRDGGMIATVKIISYAVPETAVRAAAQAVQGAVSFARPVLRDATLIITQTPGGPGEKGSEAIAARLEALGMTLRTQITVPHEIDPIARALATAQGDMILVLTASATSDPNDTAPAALRAAGGRVERFGMPVDPGNLLFLGELGGRPVIGLPGCARAPSLNGADRVLSRVACGIAVTAGDIAGMGVGGLLKEIPTRPMPRRGRKDTAG
ncbi:MAG: molybdopterin-binding protein [Roseovarius sp.]|nr:molybdopterin-binding protein [Roseovarius sp.]